MPTVVCLKRILDSFFAATGLTINYHKSTFIPMNLHDHVARDMARCLGCTISAFPQPYHGLPLSPTKLHVSDYQPLVSCLDRYVPSWKARFLDSGARLLLTTSVLSSLPVYWMASLPLPKTVIAATERRMRAFIWTGNDHCHGCQCLMAWQLVLRPKNEGGLGIKSVETQNHCLLMKFIHSAETTPWKTWFLNELRGDLGDGHSDSTFLGCIVTEEFNHYRAVTRVLLRDGKSCSFWFDDWHKKGPLFLAFPALFTHTTRAHVSVHNVLSGSRPALHLQPRLTRAAAAEHDELDSLLAEVRLGSSTDTHLVTGSTKGTARRLPTVPFTTLEELTKTPLSSGTRASPRR